MLSLSHNCPKILLSCIRCASSGCPTEVDYDLLQRSKLPTEHFQNSLPTLKVPKLEDTLLRYLNTQKSFLSEDEYRKVETSASNFAQGIGRKVQDELVYYSKTEKKNSSFITEMWTDMYLKDRRPVVMTHTPALVFGDVTNDEKYQKIDIRLTNMLYSSIRFKRSYDSGLLEPDVFHLKPKRSDTEFFRTFTSWLPESISCYGAYMFKAFPLDMSQHPYLFNSTRIPLIDRDMIKRFPNGKHVLVVRNGRMYTFDILTNENRGIAPKQILSNVRYILQQPTSQEAEDLGIGVLTTMDRNEWGAARQELLALEGNEQLLEKIDSAVFVVCLDHHDAGSVTQQVQDFLHGPADSRWFDKSVALLFNERSGTGALTFEHSWGDGVAVLRYFNEIFRDSTERPVVHGITEEASEHLPTPQVECLKPLLTDRLKREVLPTAKHDYDVRRSQLLFTYRALNDFGKNDVKQAKLSPDAIMQLALQMAFKKMHNQTPATYESCSTAAFKHGRTDAIRPATIATNAFCEAALKSADPKRLREILEECSERHMQITKETAMGKGWDRHLFALQHFCMKHEDKLPDLFASSSFARINHVRLSTSTLSSDALLIGGFAPVVPDGYGVGYKISSDQCGISLSTWKGQDTKLEEFADAFQESIIFISKLCSNK